MPEPELVFKEGEVVEVYNPETNTKKTGEIAFVEKFGSSYYYKVYFSEDGSRNGIQFIDRNPLPERYIAKPGEMSKIEQYCSKLKRINPQQIKEATLFLDPNITDEETKKHPKFAMFKRELDTLSPNIQARQSLLLNNNEFNNTKLLLLDLRQAIESMKDHPKFEMLGEEDLRLMYLHLVRVYNQLCDEILFHCKDKGNDKNKNRLPDYIDYLLKIIFEDLLWSYGTGQSRDWLDRLKKMNVDPMLYRDMAVDHRSMAIPIGDSTATRWRRSDDPHKRSWPTYLAGFVGMVLVAALTFLLITLSPALPFYLSIAATVLGGLVGALIGTKLGPGLNARLRPKSCRYYDEYMELSEKILRKEKNKTLSSEEILAKLASCERGVNILSYSHFFPFGGFAPVKASDMGDSSHYGRELTFFKPVPKGPYKGKTPIEVLKTSQNPAAQDLIKALEERRDGSASLSKA